VDLFVRTTNYLAIKMYQQFGYSVYRRVKGYYQNSTGGRGNEDEDAFGNHFCHSSIYDRYEKAAEEGQVQAKYTGEWRKLFSISGSSFLLARRRSVSRTPNKRTQLGKPALRP